MFDIFLLILGALIPVFIGIALVGVAIIAIGMTVIQYVYNHYIEKI